MQLCKCPGENADVHDLPAIVQLEHSGIKVSVGLPDDKDFSRVVCEQTQTGWRCLGDECVKSSACKHCKFVIDEAVFEAKMQASSGTSSNRKRLSTNRNGVGRRRIDLDILRSNWDKSGEVFSRAAHGLNTLTGTHNPLPPSVCKCALSASTNGAISLYLSCFVSSFDEQASYTWTPVQMQVYE
jgi:hypothetical protein